MYLGYVSICFSLQVIFANSNPNDDAGDMVFLTAIFRHGDRTPVDPYPNDPYRNSSYWPAGWGELTNTGKRGEYQLGRFLRDRYKDFIPKKYRKEDIYVQSTDVDRTLMSAYSSLAGLYEPDLNDNWSPDIKWQPIPVHTTPERSDMVLAAKKYCPRYDSEIRALKSTPEFQKIYADNRQLFQYLTESSGLNVTDINNIETLYNTLFIETLYNLTLPNWTKNVFPQPMKYLSDFSFSIACYNQQLARLKIGPLISDIHKHMKQKVEGKLSPNRKAWLYSGHDTTIANVLQALKVFELHSPPYGSLILMELRKKNNSHFVSIHYKNSTGNPLQLKLPDCDALCPFRQFSEIIKPILPKDWENECQEEHLVGAIYVKLAEKNFIGIGIFLSTMFLLFIFLALRFYKKQYHPQKDFVYHSLKMDVQT